MDRKNLADRLLNAIDDKKNPSVVGLDPRIDRIPDHIKEEAGDRAETPFEAVRYSFEEFNKSIIDEIKDIVPAVKPQVAFYEQYGSHGIKAFEETIDYAKDKGLIVISDVKRNDIGSTAEAYAAAHLGGVERINKEFTHSFDSDMVTVNAYLGSDGVKPFLDVCEEYGKGIFILVKTSNPSSGELQDKEIMGEGKVYESMAELVRKWGDDLVGDRGYSSVGAVVGATYPEEAEKLREMMKRAIFLVPGYGAQGGTADDIIPCFNEDGYGGIVNSSRGIIFAYEREPYSEKFGDKNFAKASRQAALDMKKDIRKSLEKGKKVPDGW
ncbi:MAG: orotidine-5'-phosphate decarboxylase [Candidatus Saliniplasma sp.]